MNKDWEKELEEILPKTSGETMSYHQYLAVKSFIHNLLAAQKKEIVETIEKMRADNVAGAMNAYHNFLISEIINKLKE